STYGRLMNRLLVCSSAVKTVAVLNFEQVDDEEHARYDLTQRTVVRRWTWGTARVQEHGWPGRCCTATAFSSDGRLIAVGLENGEVYLFDGTGWRRYKPLDEAVSAIAFLPTNRAFLTGASLVTRESLHTTREGQNAHEAQVTASACSMGGRLFATAD